MQRLTLQDREPDLDLVQPARPFRGVVEVHVGMACKPPVVPGLVGVEVVEDDVEPLAGIGRHHLIHEGEELVAAAALLVSGLHLAGSYLERREKVEVPCRL